MKVQLGSTHSFDMCPIQPKLPIECACVLILQFIHSNIHQVSLVVVTEFKLKFCDNATIGNVIKIKLK